MNTQLEQVMQARGKRLVAELKARGELSRKNLKAIWMPRMADLDAAIMLQLRLQRVAELYWAAFQTEHAPEGQGLGAGLARLLERFREEAGAAFWCWRGDGFDLLVSQLATHDAVYRRGCKVLDTFRRAFYEDELSAALRPALAKFANQRKFGNETLDDLVERACRVLLGEASGPPPQNVGEALQELYREEEEFNKLRPYWKDDMTMGQAIAAYEAARAGPATADA
jgi:hypothetical protein